jgi:hypothetical protein
MNVVLKEFVPMILPGWVFSQRILGHTLFARVQLHMEHVGWQMPPLIASIYVHVNWNMLGLMNHAIDSVALPPVTCI